MRTKRNSQFQIGKETGLKVMPVENSYESNRRFENIPDLNKTSLSSSCGTSLILPGHSGKKFEAEFRAPFRFNLKLHSKSNSACQKRGMWSDMTARNGRLVATSAFGFLRILVGIFIPIFVSIE